MKRILSFVLCAAMLMSCLVFAADADEAQTPPTVESVIDMLFALSESSTNAELAAAIAAYESLTDAQKADVWNANKIVSTCDDKAKNIVKQVDSLPAVEFTDVYHHGKIVDNALATYEILVDSSKALVTNYDKLDAIAKRLNGLREWDANKKVNILNSALNAMSKYTQEDIDNYAKQAAKGMYYTFEEVGYVFEGDPTTGYFGLENNENEKVRQQKYVKLDFDMKVTDIDAVMGWPVLFKMSTDIENGGYVGYDFINGQFFYGELTHISHGAIEKIYVSAPAEFSLGVWHHLTYIYDNDKITVMFDGETVLEADFRGEYKYCITYPWLCNYEMTNCVFTDRFDKQTLSPFRSAINDPTGWAKRGNDRDAVMLDHVKTALEDARDMYYGNADKKIEPLTDEEKAQVVGIDVLDKVAAMIERVGKNDVVVNGGTANVELAAEGETVNITAAAAPEGKEFDKWTVVSGDVTLVDETKASTSFTMGAAKVEITATYKDAYRRGDVNGDGSINARDISAIMKAMLGNAPKGYNEKAADFNGDGTVNARDISAIMFGLLG